MNPILHNRTQQYITNFLTHPSHGLLLTGPTGIGKTYLAQWLSTQLGKEAIVITAESEKKGIAIEQIRDLYSLTQTGSPLVIILEHADTMSHAAQNAFLKLLEEPPENISFILTARTTHNMLATIRSRTQHIQVLPPTKTQLKEYAASQGFDDTSLTALLHTSEGKPGTLFSLLQEPEQRTAHESNVTAAKQFYANTPFQRHIYCIAAGFEKDTMHALLDMLAIIVQALIHNSQQNSTAQQKLIRQAGLIETTATRIFKQNGNPKIHMTKLCQEL